MSFQDRVRFPSRSRSILPTMQITGMLYGAKLLQFVGFPTAEVLGPAATDDEIKALIGK